jgi:putative peptidoglycan lipid II flippase
MSQPEGRSAGSSAAAANRQIARSTGIIMVALAFSQVVGVVESSLLGSTFGTGAANEAFFAANRIPSILFSLVAGGALSSAFIPIFTGYLTRDEHSAAWKLVSAVANLAFLILAALSLLAALFAPQIVHYVLAPGFSARGPELEAMTVNLLRIQLPSAAIFALSGLAMGVLNAHQKFLLPAIAPAMYNLGLIFGILVLGPSMGVYGVSWGVVIGAALHLAVQLPDLLRLPHRAYWPDLGLKMPAVHDVMRLMGPRLLGVAVVQLNFWLNTFLASFQAQTHLPGILSGIPLVVMPEGSITSISLAFPLVMMPEAAIAQSVAMAAMPTFSALVALGKMNDMRSSLSATLRGVLLLAIPATVGLVLLRSPIVALIFQRKAFNATSTELVAWAVLWYGIGLVGHCLVEIVSRAFYALHDTRTPVMVGAAAMTLNLLLSVLFSALFQRLGWMPHGGLALANSLATFLEMLGLVVLMRRRLGGLELGPIQRAVVQAGAASLVMGVALAYWVQGSANLPSAMQVLGGVALGGGLYGLGLVLLGVKETRWAWRFIKKRVESRK